VIHSSIIKIQPRRVPRRERKSAHPFDPDDLLSDYHQSISSINKTASFVENIVKPGNAVPRRYEPKSVMQKNAVGGRPKSAIEAARF
jgi:hypothetical protein